MSLWMVPNLLASSRCSHAGLEHEREAELGSSRCHVAIALHAPKVSHRHAGGRKELLLPQLILQVHTVQVNTRV